MHRKRQAGRHRLKNAGDRHKRQIIRKKKNEGEDTKRVQEEECKSHEKVSEAKGGKGRGGES